MGNCLITKFLGTVDNPMLPTTDEIIIRAKRLSSYGQNQALLQLEGYASETYKIEVIGDGVFTTTSYADLSDPEKTKKSYEFNGTDTGLLNFWFSNGDYSVKISNKNKLIKFRLQKFGSALPTLFDITTDDFKFLSPVLSVLSLCRTNIQGDLSDFQYLTGITLPFEFMDSQVKGSLESLIEGQIAQGRVNGTFRVGCNSYITFNGSVVGNGTEKYVYLGTSMDGHDPTAAEITQGWCVR